MSFVIDQSLSYKWPVSVEFPIDGGRYDKQTFDAEFKRVPQPRIKQIYELSNANELSDEELCNEVLLGWTGIIDSKKQDVPYSESAKKALLDTPLVTKALVTAWMESLNGAKRKN